MTTSSPSRPRFPVRLSRTQTLILQSYFALRHDWPAEWIGSHEIREWIRAWLRETKLERKAPSESMVQKTLVAAGLPHRIGGRPRNESRVETAGPFVPVRPDPPRPRLRPRRSGPSCYPR